MIHIEKLNYRYRDGKQYALRDVNLVIEAGGFVVITGPSGCGKSTLALAIGGYLFRQFDGEVDGSIIIDGMNVRQTQIHDVAETVGLVQQNPEAQFCTLTVRDEIAFGLENRRLAPDMILERMSWALSIVGAGHLTERSLATLSGGEKQKIAIAAMMATKPKVIIFDEPTSNLDPTATTEVFDVIDSLRKQSGITVMVIEHKVDALLRFNPRVIVMEEGHIIHDRTRLEMKHKDYINQPAVHYPEYSTLCIDVQNLCAGFNGLPVLHDLSFRVKAGEFISIMGDNGSGKTTLLHCLLGLHQPGAGRVEVMGGDTRKTPVSLLAQSVGFIFQNPDHQLFTDSVWEEAIFAPRNFGKLDKTTEDRVDELLNRCGLSDRRLDHPYRLSYGQKRRLNLISVLSYMPQLLLLDEVLIGQDPENAAFILDLLMEHVAGGGCVILVNHAPRITIRYTSRILFLSEGRLMVDAPTRQAFEQLKSLGRQAYVA